MTLRQSGLRLVNGIRKLANGLRPFGEAVWPGVRNDLFVAHESIYVFASGYARSRRVLDAGCGTGYGTHLLGARGASRVLGIDIDSLSIRYARRNFQSANVTFQKGDLENLRLAPRSFDVAVASNSLEHLNEPGRFLRALREGLVADGIALLAIPPIYSEADLKTHADIRYHRNSLFVVQWMTLLRVTGFDYQCFLHRMVDDSLKPDFHSHAPSTLTVDNFTFHEVSDTEFLSTPSISAVFVIRLAKSANEPS